MSQTRNEIIDEFGLRLNYLEHLCTETQGNCEECQFGGECIINAMDLDVVDALGGFRKLIRRVMDYDYETPTGEAQPFDCAKCLHSEICCACMVPQMNCVHYLAK